MTFLQKIFTEFIIIFTLFTENRMYDTAHTILYYLTVSTCYGHFSECI
jgi:hypothetical protein